MRATFRAFDSVRFRWWITGLFLSGVGSWMQTTALDWVVLTQLTDHSAAADALVLSLQTAVQLVLLPFAGLVTDRFSRRRVLLVTQVGQGVLALALGVLVASGGANLVTVCLLVTCVGAVQAFDGPARQSFVSQLVPPTAIANGVALNAATFNVAKLVGPAVAGLLLGIIGAGTIFLINAISFAAMIIALRAIGPVIEPVRPPSRASDIVGGFAYVIRRPPLMGTLALVLIVVGCIGGSLNLLVVSTATRQLGTDAQQYGLLNSAVAVGSIVGALFTAGRREPSVRLALAAAAGLGVALGIAGAVPGYWSLAVCLILAGFCIMTVMASCNGFVQTATADGFRGRVMGLYLAVWMAGVPIGSTVLGHLADDPGPQTALLTAGAVCLIAGVLGGVVLGATRRISRRPGTPGAEARGWRSSPRGSTARTASARRGRRSRPATARR